MSSTLRGMGKQFMAREPAHTLRVSRTVYVNCCNAAREERMKLEEWLPRALHQQIIDERTARERDAYREECVSATVRPTWEEFRAKAGLPKV